MLRYDEDGKLTSRPPDIVIFFGLFFYGVAATFMALYVLFNPICR